MNYENSNNKYDINKTNENNNGAESNPVSDSSRHGKKQRANLKKATGKLSPSVNKDSENSSKATSIAVEQTGAAENVKVESPDQNTHGTANLSETDRLAKIVEKTLERNRILSHKVVDESTTKEDLLNDVARTLQMFVSQDDSLWLTMGEMVWNSIQRVEKLSGGAYNEDFDGAGVLATVTKIARKINEISISKTGIAQNVDNLADTLYEYSRIYNKLIGSVAGEGSDETVRLKRTVLFEKYKDIKKSYCREAITRTNPAEALEIAREKLVGTDLRYSVEKFKKDIAHLPKNKDKAAVRNGNAAQPEPPAAEDFKLSEKVKRILTSAEKLCAAADWNEIIEEGLQLFVLFKEKRKKNQFSLLYS